MPKKEKIYCRTRMLLIALTTDEFAVLKKKSENTAYRTLSHFVRALLFEKKIVTWYRSRSLDELLPVAGKIGDELDAISRNWSRIIKTLRENSQKSENSPKNENRENGENADFAETLDLLLKEESRISQTITDIKSILLKFIEDGSKDQDMRRHVHNS